MERKEIMTRNCRLVNTKRTTVDQESMDSLNKDGPLIDNIEIEYNCDVCHKNFTGFNLYQSHVLKCSNKMNKLLEDLPVEKLEIEYSCDNCNKNYPDMTGYENHRCSDSVGRCEDSVDENVELECICEDCHDIFTSLSEYKKHRLKNCRSLSIQGIYRYRYSCTECEVKFKSKSGLASHIRFHLLKPYKCDQCTEEFRLKAEFRMHRCHQPIIRNKKSIVCFFCNHSTSSRRNIFGHYEQKHGVELEEEIIQFKNFHLFELWKNALEGETNTKLVQKSRFGSNPEKIRYVCFKDGKIKNSAMAQSSKESGHVPAVSNCCCCPAQIKVMVNDQSVIAKYLNNHVGHESEIKTVVLTKPEREFVAEKISQKLCFYKILDDIRESISDDCLEQIHLLTMTDLKNIARDFNLLNDKKKDSCQT